MTRNPGRRSPRRLLREQRPGELGDHDHAERRVDDAANQHEQDREQDPDPRLAAVDLVRAGEAELDDRGIQVLREEDAAVSFAAHVASDPGRDEGRDGKALIEVQVVPRAGPEHHSVHRDLLGLIR